MTKTALTLGLILLPTAAAAHPGHAALVEGAAHYLADPFHLGLTAGAVFLLLAIRRRLAR